MNSNGLNSSEQIGNTNAHPQLNHGLLVLEIS